MSRTLSAKLISAIQASQTGEVLLAFLDINCNGSHTYIVNDTQAQTYNANTYQPFPFTIKLSDDVDGQVPSCVVQIDNTDQSIMTALQNCPVSTPPTVTIYAMLADQIGTLEIPAMSFTLRDVQGDTSTLQFSLTMNMTSDEPFPGDSFNPGNFPTLFIDPGLPTQAL